MLYKFLITVCFFITASFLIEGSLHNEISIESQESKTKDLTSVFNKIKWISKSDKDIWMMNQSHAGSHPKMNQWERLAIVIDKTKSPKTAQFYQLQAGALEWSDDLIKKQVAYRASCFTCHNNGPRAIRVIPGSASLIEKAQIELMNMRIKTYGRIQYNKSHDEKDKTLKTPFHYSEASENVELKVKTCLLCHNENGFFGRGTLKRQQIGTIRFLVENNHMPPKGFSLSSKEKKEIQDFLMGF